MVANNPIIPSTKISYARFQGKEIIPFMVQQIHPPLSIARIQWLDLQNYHQGKELQSCSLSSQLVGIDTVLNLSLASHFCYGQNM